MIERAREAMRIVEPKIKEVIRQRGKGGKLVIDFDDLHYFGTPEECRVLYLKLKEDGDQLELLKEVNGLLIEAMIDHKVIARKDLSHITLNKQTKRYEANQLHLTLLNSTFALKDLMKN